MDNRQVGDIHGSSNRLSRILNLSTDTLDYRIIEHIGYYTLRLERLTRPISEKDPLRKINAQDTDANRRVGLPRFHVSASDDLIPLLESLVIRIEVYIIYCKPPTYVHILIFRIPHDCLRVKISDM